MLLLTLALSIASPVSALPPELQRAPQSASKNRATRKRTPVRLVRLTPRCGVAVPCQTDPNRRYRLAGSTTIVSSAKDREVLRGQAMACGTTGAPVCPSNGTTLLRTSD